MEKVPEILQIFSNLRQSVCRQLFMLVTSLDLSRLDRVSLNSYFKADQLVLYASISGFPGTYSFEIVEHRLFGKLITFN